MFVNKILRVSSRSINRKTTMCSFRLVRSSYNFVNLPLSSKYYHQPLPTQIGQAFLLATREQKLNQKCYLLENITEILQRDPKLYTARMRQSLIRQLKKWEGGTGRMQRVATIAWIIKKMNLQDQLKDLYQQIARRVYSDEWYVNLDQSVKALQAFTILGAQTMKEEIYEKIQRNLGLTMLENNMLIYHRITRSLIEAGRHASPLWLKLEEQVIGNLGMNYDTKIILDIFQSFAISRNGSSIFYQIIQQVLYKGHLDNKTFRLRSNLNDFEATGEYFALLVQTYAIVHKNAQVPLQPDFLDYLYKSMLSKQVQYPKITSLIKLLKHLQGVGFYEEEAQKILRHVFVREGLESYHAIQEIEELYYLLQTRYGRVPQSVMRNVEKIVMKDMQRKILPLPASIKIVQFLLQHKHVEDPLQIQNQELIGTLQRYLQAQYKYLYPQDAKEVRRALQQMLLPIDKNELRLIDSPKGSKTQ